MTCLTKCKAHKPALRCMQCLTSDIRLHKQPVCALGYYSSTCSQRLLTASTPAFATTLGIMDLTLPLLLVPHTSCC
jgi:hypothetical protein